MGTGTELDEVIARLYEAGADVAGMSWTLALAGVQRAVRGHAVVVLAVDVPRRSVHFVAEAGDAPPQALLEYTHSYHRIDPLRSHVLSAAVGRWVHCHEVFNETFVARDAFYQSFLLPYGGRWVSGVKLMEEGGTALILAVIRRPEQGPLVGDAFVACDHLSWHIAKAYVLMRLRGMHERRHAFAQAVLQHLGSPVFLLDAECQVLFSNRIARVMLSAGTALYELDGRLALWHPEDDRALRARAAQLCRMAQDGRFAGTTYVAISACDHVGIARPAKLRVVGIMLTLLRDQETTAFGAIPMLLAIPHELNRAPTPDVAVVARAFGLTKAEAEVAICLALGMSVEQIAAQRVKAVSTVRSQVKSVFSKMGCTRQVEVMIHVLSIPFMFFSRRRDDDDGDEDGMARVVFSPRRPLPQSPRASAIPASDDFG